MAGIRLAKIEVALSERGNLPLGPRVVEDADMGVEVCVGARHCCSVSFSREPPVSRGWYCVLLAGARQKVPVFVELHLAAAKGTALDDLGLCHLCSPRFRNMAIAG